MKLRDLQTSWPRFHSKLFCIFACEGCYTDYRRLAEHYLEHNWDDLKFFGIHPKILRQVIDDEETKPKARKRAQSVNNQTAEVDEISHAVTDFQTGKETSH